MKKIVVTIVALSLLLAVLPIKAQAGKSVPRVMWKLTCPDALSMAEANARGCGQYHYSAYINKNKLYSNYFFQVKTRGRFVMFGNELYPLNRRYKVSMVNFFTRTEIPTIINESTHSFLLNYSNYPLELQYESFFYIDGAPYGTEISVNGTVDTY